MSLALSHNEDAYVALGAAAQRRYPNEELIRFLSRHYFSIPKDRRSAVRILDIGCGSGANLWMLAREGFDAYGDDFSPAAIALCREALRNWGCTATLGVSDMVATIHPANHFDAAVDVFSSYCLDESDFTKMLTEMFRIIKPGGRFFSYAPSTGSDAFKNHHPARLVDRTTLDGIRRQTSPYFGNFYPFRFVSIEGFRHSLRAAGFDVESAETVSRSYNAGTEIFEFVVVSARKPL